METRQKWAHTMFEFDWVVGLSVNGRKLSQNNEWRLLTIPMSTPDFVGGGQIISVKPNAQSCILFIWLGKKMNQEMYGHNQHV